MCVPLGWDPVPITNGVYFPGFSAEFQDERSWLKPLWIGSIRTGELRNEGAAIAYQLLEHLRGIALVDRVSVPGGFHYRITPNGFKYYYDANVFSNNPDHLRYLCYSRIRPTRVIDMSANRIVMRVRFQWRDEQYAPWASDQFIRKHAVVLISPPRVAVATFTRNGSPNDIEDVWSFPWTLKALQSTSGGLPRVVATEVWTTPIVKEPRR